MSDKPDIRQITAEEIQSLLREGQTSQDDALSRITLSDAYNLPKGRILLIYDKERGALYKSRKDVFAVLNSALEHPISHFLKGRLPQGKDFVAKVPELSDCSFAGESGVE